MKQAAIADMLGAWLRLRRHGCRRLSTAAQMTPVESTHSKKRSTSSSKLKSSRTTAFKPTKEQFAKSGNNSFDFDEANEKGSQSAKAHHSSAATKTYSSPAAAAASVVRSTAVFADMDYYGLIGSSAIYNMPLLDRLLHLLRARSTGTEVPDRDVVDATAVLPLVAEFGSPECVLFVKESIDAAALTLISCDWSIVSPSAARAFMDSFTCRALRYYNPNELSMAMRVTAFCKRPATVRLASALATKICERFTGLDARELAAWHPNSMCHTLTALASLPPQPALFASVARTIADEAARRVTMTKQLRKAERRTFAVQQSLLRSGKTLAADAIGREVAPLDGDDNGGADGTSTSAAASAANTSETPFSDPPMASPRNSPLAVMEDGAVAGLAAGLYAPHLFSGSPAAGNSSSSSLRPAAGSSSGGGSSFPLPAHSPAAARAREQVYQAAGGKAAVAAAAAVAQSSSGDSGDSTSYRISSSFLSDRQVASSLVPRTSRLVKLLSGCAALGGLTRSHPLWQVVVDKTSHAVIEADTQAGSSSSSSSTAGYGTPHGQHAEVGAGGERILHFSAPIIAETLWALALAQPRPQPHYNLRSKNASVSAGSSPAAVDSAEAVAVTEAAAGGAPTATIQAAAADGAVENVPSSYSSTASATSSQASSSAAAALAGREGVWSSKPFVLMGRNLLAHFPLSSLSHDQLVKLLWAYARTGYWTALPGMVAACARELGRRLRAGSDPTACYGSDGGHSIESLLSSRPISTGEAARAAWCLGSIASSGGGGGPSQPFAHWLPDFFASLQAEMLRRWREEPGAEWSLTSPQHISMMLWGCAQARAGTQALFAFVADEVTAATAADAAEWRRAQDALLLQRQAESDEQVGSDGVEASSSSSSSASPSASPLPWSQRLGRHHAQPSASGSDAPSSSSASPSAAALSRLSLSREAEAAVFSSCRLGQLTLSRWTAGEVSMTAWAYATMGVAHRGLFGAMASTARASWWIPLRDDRPRSLHMARKNSGAAAAAAAAAGGGKNGKGGSAGGKGAGEEEEGPPLPAVQYYWLSNYLYSLALAGQFPSYPSYISSFSRRLGKLAPEAQKGFTSPQLQMMHLVIATAKRYNLKVLSSAGLLHQPPADEVAPAAANDTSKRSTSEAVENKEDSSGATKQPPSSRSDRQAAARTLPLIQPFPDALITAAYNARITLLNRVAEKQRHAPPSPFIARCRSALLAVCASAEAAAGVPVGSVLRPQWELVTGKGMIVDMALVVTSSAAAGVGEGGGGGSSKRAKAAGERSDATAALLRLAIEVEGPGHYLPLPYALPPSLTSVVDSSSASPVSLPHPFQPGQTSPLSSAVPLPVPGPPLVYNPATRAKHALLAASGWRTAHLCYKQWELAASGNAAAAKGSGAMEAAQQALLRRCIAEAGVDLTAVVRQTVTANKGKGAELV